MKFPMAVVAPVLLILGVGYALVLVEFGKFHTNYVQSPIVSLEVYAATYIPFWVYSFGVPFIAILSLWHAYLGYRNNINRVIVHCVECSTAVALGGCLYISVDTIRNNQTPPESVAGLVGGILSFLSLIALNAFIPFLVEYCEYTGRKFHSSGSFAPDLIAKSQHYTAAPQQFKEFHKV